MHHDELVRVDREREGGDVVRRVDQAGERLRQVEAHHGAVALPVPVERDGQAGLRDVVAHGHRQLLERDRSRRAPHERLEELIDVRTGVGQAKPHRDTADRRMGSQVRGRGGDDGGGAVLAHDAEVQRRAERIEVRTGGVEGFGSGDARRGEVEVIGEDQVEGVQPHQLVGPVPGDHLGRLVREHDRPRLVHEHGQLAPQNQDRLEEAQTSITVTEVEHDRRS